jgi:hypothetical protein
MKLWGAMYVLVEITKNITSFGVLVYRVHNDKFKVQWLLYVP